MKTIDSIEFKDLTENPWVICRDDTIRQCDSYTIQVNEDTEYFNKKWRVEYFTTLSCGCCSDDVIDYFSMEEVYSTESAAVINEKCGNNLNEIGDE